MELKETIIALEKSLLTFEVRHSEAKLRQLLSPDFKEIGASGAYFGLDEVLSRLPTEESWSAHAQDFEFHEIASGVCQLIFRAFSRSHSDDTGTYSHRSSIWQQYDDGWKMIFHQGTPVQPFKVLS